MFTVNDMIIVVVKGFVDMSQCIYLVEMRSTINSKGGGGGGRGRRDRELNPLVLLKIIRTKTPYILLRNFRK